MLATLRDKMVGLAVEVGDGAVWANASRSRMAHSLVLVPADRPAGDYWIGNMIPTVIDDDLAAARARNRKTLQGYVALPNYRNYWKECGYVEEMAAIEKAIAEKRNDDVPGLLTDRWLADTTLFGPASKVRDGVEARRAAGVKTPILVPSAVSGGQMRAIENLLTAYKS